MLSAHSRKAVKVRRVAQGNARTALSPSDCGPPLVTDLEQRSETPATPTSSAPATSRGRDQGGRRDTRERPLSLEVTRRFGPAVERGAQCRTAWRGKRKVGGVPSPQWVGIDPRGGMRLPARSPECRYVVHAAVARVAARAAPGVSADGPARGQRSRLRRGFGASLSLDAKSADGPTDALKAGPAPWRNAPRCVSAQAPTARGGALRVPGLPPRNAPRSAPSGEFLKEKGPGILKDSGPFHGRGDWI